MLVYYVSLVNGCHFSVSSPESIEGKECLESGSGPRLGASDSERSLDLVHLLRSFHDFIRGEQGTLGQHGGKISAGKKGQSGEVCRVCHFATCRQLPRNFMSVEELYEYEWKECKKYRFSLIVLELPPTEGPSKSFLLQLSRRGHVVPSGGPKVTECLDSRLVRLIHRISFWKATAPSIYRA